MFSSPINVFIDPSRPWLISIGKNVKITRGVTILTHGYDWSVLNGVYGDILGSSGKINIGNNVFIGMNATILKGTTIGDNSIIGAGALVRGGTYPENSVIAGNPAKVVCTHEEYRNKRIEAQYEEAKELAYEYYKRTGKYPPIEVFHEFFWLFTNRNIPVDNSILKGMLHINDNIQKTWHQFMHTSPQFLSYDEFIEYLFLKERIDDDT